MLVCEAETVEAKSRPDEFTPGVGEDEVAIPEYLCRVRLLSGVAPSG
jgi:hypothetical protein